MSSHWLLSFEPNGWSAHLMYTSSNAFFLSLQLGRLWKMVSEALWKFRYLISSAILLSPQLAISSYKTLKLVKNGLSLLNLCLLFLKDFLVFPVLVNGLQKYMMSKLKWGWPTFLASSLPFATLQAEHNINLFPVRDFLNYYEGFVGNSQSSCSHTSLNTI